MRILFSFVGGHGHLVPLLPLARAARAAGHDVAFACAQGMTRVVRAAGFSCTRVGTRASRELARIPLLPLDGAREESDLAERFVRRAARARAPELGELLASGRHDLVVCDEADFGAMLAAERAGLPRASVQVIACGSFVRADVVVDALEDLRGELGLCPDPGLDMLQRPLVLSPFPASFRDPAHSLPPGAYSMRPAVLERGEGAADSWKPPPGNGPLVYFTLGTVFNMESGDLLERVIGALRELPIRLVATVGEGIDPADMGPRLAHVEVRRFVPQAALLPHCDLVVSHGGSGSVMGALAHGLPSVLLPIGADQPANADRCTTLGVGLALSADADADVVGSSVLKALGDEGLRSNARRMQAEIAELPGAAQAVRLFETVADGGGPSGSD